MKKTLIALVAMGGAVSGAEVLVESQVDDLSTPITLSYTTSDYFISKTGSDTSPAWGEMVITFTLNGLATAGTEHNLVNVLSSNIGTGQGQSVQYNAYGFYVNGSTLTFGRSHCNASNSLTLADNKVVVTDSLAANTTYTLTILSQATGSTVGRGSDNFAITLTSDAGVNITKTAAGFGLNGEKCTGFVLGDADLNGSATFSANVPEPATATLSLLALAGLAARRRRK